MHRNFSRRELLLGLFSRWQSRDIPGGKTGFGVLEREIDSLLQARDFARAVEMLQELLQISPEHLQARNKLGYCLLQTGALAAAAQELQTVLDKKPEDNFALLYLGLTLAWQGDPDQALAYWAEYYNPEQPLIQREINLLLALKNTSGLSQPEDVAQRVQQAIEKQHRLDQGQ